MKKLILILMVGIILTQTYEDIVMLKNGSEIHGIIIEQKPNEYIKIQSGKNIFVYQMDEIELIKKLLNYHTLRLPCDSAYTAFSPMTVGVQGILNRRRVCEG